MRKKPCWCAVLLPDEWGGPAVLPAASEWSVHARSAARRGIAAQWLPRWLSILSFGASPAALVWGSGSGIFIRNDTWQL